MEIRTYSVAFKVGWASHTALWDQLCKALPNILKVAQAQTQVTSRLSSLLIDSKHCMPSEISTASTGYFDLVVGHSQGALYWLRQPERWNKLLVINGFPLFPQRPDWPNGIAPRILKQMMKRFRATPEKVLREFYENCAWISPPLVPVQRYPDLAAELLVLLHTDTRKIWQERARDIFFIAGNQDKIVPVAMSKDSAQFLSFNHTYFEESGHMLPLTHPELCATWLARALNILP